MEIPKSLARLRSRAGTHRSGFKVLITGRPGTGKSYFAASLPGGPGERVFLECGEGGIEQYLDPDDIVFTIESPDDYLRAIQFAVENSTARGGPIVSLGIDPANLQWENHMDYWQEKLGRDIQGGDWKKVKAGWKLTLRTIQRSSLNVAMTCHLKDLVYQEASAAPGMKGKLEMKEALLPQIEKNVPYIVDLGLLMEVETDAKFRPTPKHTVTAFKVRRPRSVPPEDFHVGKSWKFDSRKPKNPWDMIVKPIEEAWKIGADSWDDLPQSLEEAEAELDLQETVSSAEVGRLIKLIEKQKTLKEFATVWEREISPCFQGMTAEDVSVVNKAKDTKKAELMANGGK